MIQVSLNALVFVYLAVMLGTILGAWLLSTWSRQRRERRYFRHVLRCSQCGFEFEDASNTALPACPRCQSLNERRRLSRL